MAGYGLYTDSTMSDIDNMLNGIPFTPIQLPKTLSELRGEEQWRNKKPTAKKSLQRAPQGTGYVEQYKDRNTVRDVFVLKQMEGRLNEVEDVTVDCGRDELPSANLDDLRVYDNYHFDRNWERALPVDDFEEKITNVLEAYSVIIIKGRTGCGKSTRIPQFILDHCKNKKVGCNIVVAQPRRIAAVSVARRVCSERNLELGTLVGYQIGQDKSMCSDTRLLYCTTNVLLLKLVTSKCIDQYTHIILDEVHERTLEMDFLFIVIKKLREISNAKTKIIIMSATFDTSKFSKYFTMRGRVEIEPYTLNIPKKMSHNVVIFYLDHLYPFLPTLPHICAGDEPNISEEGYDAAADLIKAFDKIDEEENQTAGRSQKYRNSVLVFLPGILEIERLSEKLRKRASLDHLSWKIVVLHSTITSTEQENIFAPSAYGSRKIVLSTNIAESSITVPDAKYVIDYCLTKELVCDKTTNYTSLQLCWCSKNNCEQRAGRVGRVGEGRVYRMVTEEFYNQLEREPIPQMLRCPLDQLVLNAKLLNMGEPRHIFSLALNSPDLTEIGHTIKSLKEVGGLLVSSNRKYSEYDGDITFLGNVMAKLPMDIRLGKLIFLGYVFGLLDEAVIMACTMACRNLFSNPFGEQLRVYSSKLGWATGSCSDCITFLFAYQVWRNKHNRGELSRPEDEKAWARTHYVQVKALREVAALVKEVNDRLIKLDITEPAGASELSDCERALLLKIILAGAFYPNYFVKSPSGSNTDEREAVKILGGRDPYSTVYLQGMPHNQPGMLYIDQIRSFFDDIEKNVNVSFDQSGMKVYVSFKPSATSSFAGKVHLAVYKAVKLRQIVKGGISINVLPPAEAKERWQQCLKRQEMMKTKKTDSTPYSTIDAEVFWPWKRDAPCTVSPIRVKVSHIENPSLFWVQHSDPESDRVLNNTHYHMNIPNKVRPLKEEPRVGELYACLFSDNNYYRCRVMQIDRTGGRNGSGTLYDVYFVDYGNSDRVPRSKLMDFSEYLLKKSIKKIPDLAVQCTLAEVAPSPFKNTYEGWSDEASSQFKSLYLERYEPAVIRVYSFVNGVASVYLYTDFSEPPFNQLLVRLGYAVESQESFLSQKDHLDLTESYKWQDSSEADSFLGHSSEISEDVLHQPDPRECYLRIRLKGPFSPLETQVYSLTQSSSGKRVKVESSSVNSVLLDANPQELYEKMLVAAFVSSSPDGSQLNARNTTILTSIPGLPSLICLLFSPSAELRPNNNSTKVAGALCGLGTYFDTEEDEVVLKSIFPENDMEIGFDIEVDKKKIDSINEIRNLMNSAMVYYNRREANITFWKQNKICTLLLDMLKTEIKSQNVTYYDKSYTWKHPPAYCSQKDTKPHVYRPIEFINLYPEDPSNLVAIKTNLEQFENISSGFRAFPKEGIYCKICDVQIYEKQTFRIHCVSSKHKHLVQNIRLSNL